MTLVRFGDGLVAFEVADDSALGIEATRERLVEERREALAAYPQYEAFHVDPAWVVVRVKRRVRTKMGVAFERGEVALGQYYDDPDDLSVKDLGAHWSVWSRNNRCHTVLRPGWVAAVTPAA